MNNNSYFQRVKQQTPTRFWINNPTLQQAKEALSVGAVGCTTNPSYVSKLFNSPSDFIQVKRTVDMLIPYIKDNTIVASLVQRAMVARLSDVFMPLYEASEGQEGFVTIQGDPYAEEDAQAIIDEGIENRTIASNIMVKIPVTTYGIEAISTLVKQDVPTMATEVMGISQAISICEAYQNAQRESGHKPPFYVTHITGILDDHFKRVITSEKLSVSQEAVTWAGLSIAKRQYALLQERKYPGKMIGGGARKLEDFTDLVGGDVHVTINWEGTADVLLQKDGVVEDRIGVYPEQAYVDELMQKLPDYRRAYEIDGMTAEEYYDYGGVELFRSSFMKGWSQLLDFIEERRRSK